MAGWIVNVLKTLLLMSSTTHVRLELIQPRRMLVYNFIPPLLTQPASLNFGMRVAFEPIQVHEGEYLERIIIPVVISIELLNAT